MIVATKIWSLMCKSGYVVHFEFKNDQNSRYIAIIYLFHDCNDRKFATNV
jgi:hypothetical protein